MRKFLLAFAVFFTTTVANAGSNIIFSKDGSKATVTLLAFSVNPDATAMFEALSQAPVDLNGKITKHFDFKSSEGAPVFNIECVFSKIVKETGSCILVMHNSPFILMEPAAKRVKVELHGADAALAAAAFVAPAGGGSEFYRSSDNRLVVSGSRDASSFAITYGY